MKIAGLRALRAAMRVTQMTRARRGSGELAIIRKRRRQRMIIVFVSGCVLGGPLPGCFVPPLPSRR